MITTTRRLLARNLWRFRTANAAVAIGVAVATAALTGALLVGDSIRGSLRGMALKRLGPVTHAVTGQSFFPTTLAKRTGLPAVTTALIVQGSAARGDETARATGVQIAAVDRGIATVSPGRCIVSGPLADMLGVEAGQAVLLAVPRSTQVADDAPLARRDRTSQLAQMRLTIERIDRSGGFVSEFSLVADQRARPRAWVNQNDLQQAVNQPGRANTLLISAGETTAIESALARAATLDDFGLSITPAGEGEAAMNSRTTYLPAAVAEAVDNEPAANAVLVALINRVATNRSAVHYAVAAGLSKPPGGPLGDDEIAVNQWTADQLNARIGDRLSLSWYSRDANGTLVEIGADDSGLSLRLARIVPMIGLGAEPTLTPEYEGLTDADSIGEWDPPADLNIDKSLVTDADEAYWDEHRAAPKLFVNLATAQRLWGGPFGRLTSVRLPAGRAEAFTQTLLAKAPPAAMGLQVRPIRVEQLAAAAGSTDFAGLYLSLSVYLIAAAVILTALLCRLAVEQRAGQYGLLAAMGFTRRKVRRLAMAEGLIVALVGSLAGLAGGVGYTALIMAGMRTWWVESVGSNLLTLHVGPGSLIVGLACGLLVSAGAIVWGVHRIGRASPTALLAGRWQNEAASPHRGRRTTLIATVALTVTAAALLIAAATEAMAPLAGALLGGGTLLTAGLLAVNRLIRPNRSASVRLTGSRALARLALANAGRRPTRTMQGATLLALTTFSLAIVGAFHKPPPADTHVKTSGAGGFALIAAADIPLPTDLADAQGRRLAGVGRPDEPVWTRANFVGLRRREGQDASCLNITRPTEPTILAVPPGVFDGRFTFARGGDGPGANWRLLDRTDADGAIPVIADEASARWILHLNIGDTIDITDDRGRPRTLRLAGTLAGSIFQSELLMGREHFRTLFPSRTGFGVILAETAPADQGHLMRTLSTSLGEFGLSVEPTALLLGRLAEVSNTYLATFQTLGAVGLLLGVVGLTVVLLRNLLERQAELALLAALGMTRRRIRRLVLGESAVALGAGLIIGFASAMATVWAGGDRTSPINWIVLTATGGGILAIALATQAVAAAWAGRHLSPADLRHE